MDKRFRKTPIDSVVPPYEERVLKNKNKSSKKGWFFGFVLVLAFVSSLSVSNTVAIYNDLEASIGNILKAGSIDFSVGTIKPEDKILSPGESVTQLAKVVSNGTLGFQYDVHIEQNGGDIEFCEELELDALLEGVNNYIGNLMTLQSVPVTYSTDTDDWSFTITLPADSVVIGSCSFDFVFSGWQENIDNYNESAFSDEEKVDDPVYGVASITVESLPEDVIVSSQNITEAISSQDGAIQEDVTPPVQEITLPSDGVESEETISESLSESQENSDEPVSELNQDPSTEDIIVSPENTVEISSE